ncbi:hypothetical protein QWZ13_12530 [Reinekea marina]|uniref:hypothetical protein n=1 Tax=Reinekea marina TaxID=1310421 RepID=UPI0025B4A44E|nr:hypothetical protein [Reinekea marina]MDN3649738.1 hypothetical protein [Reinekea marina]
MVRCRGIHAKRLPLHLRLIQENNNESSRIFKNDRCFWISNGCTFKRKYQSQRRNICARRAIFCVCAFRWWLGSNHLL